MNITQEPIVENGTCKRCGRRTRILSNGYCSRCDNVLYGQQNETRTPWYPRQSPPIIYPEYPRHPKRREYWCLMEKI